MKKYIFEQQPFDYNIFIQGISQAGKRVVGNYKPATQDQIEKFQAVLDCALPNDYKQFLQSGNGGIIDSRKIERHIAVVDVKQTVNGNEWLSEPQISIRFFYTLDESTLLEREENEGPRSSLVRNFYLPIVNSKYYDEYAYTEEAMGLGEIKLIVIAGSDDHYIALSCDNQLKGKVLAIDSGTYPEDYPEGVAKPMSNVALLADSFDEFLQSIYYEVL